MLMEDGGKYLGGFFNEMFNLQIECGDVGSSSNDTGQYAK